VGRRRSCPTCDDCCSPTAPQRLPCCNPWVLCDEARWLAGPEGFPGEPAGGGKPLPYFGFTLHLTSPPPPA